MAKKKTSKKVKKSKTRSNPELTAFAVPPPRPTAVTVIGWLFIVFCGLGLLGSLFGAGMIQLMTMCIPDFQAEMANDFAGMEGTGFWASAFLGWIKMFFRYPMLIGLFLSTVYGFILYSAVMFLKQRAWARTTLEVVTWIFIVFMTVYAVGYGVFFMAFMGHMPAQTEVESCMQANSYFKIFGVIFTIMMLAFYVVPSAFVLKFIRGKNVRDSMI